MEKYAHYEHYVPAYPPPSSVSQDYELLQIASFKLIILKYLQHKW